MFADVGSLGWRARSLDIILEGDCLRTIKSLVPIGQAISEENIFKDFLANFLYLSHGSHLGLHEGSSDKILEVDHLRTIPVKFGPKCPVVSEDKIKI